MIIGYARVSTDGQSLEAQQASLKAAGAEKVFAEKISGAKTDRKAVASAIRTLGPGDVLIVTRLDRLANWTASPCWATASTLALCVRGSTFWPLLDSTLFPSIPPPDLTFIAISSSSVDLHNPQHSTDLVGFVCLLLD
jgi:hypothetical protein